MKAEKQQQQLIDQMKKANIEMPFNMEEFKLEIEAKMKEFEKNIHTLLHGKLQNYSIRKRMIVYDRT